jgi:hypothetical protein
MNNKTYTEMLDIAVNAPILGFEGFAKEQAQSKLQAASAMMLLILDESRNGVTPSRHERILLHLKNIIKSGKEPCMDCVHYWVYTLIASALAVAKATPSIWGEFTVIEIEKFDFLMEMFAILANYISNDANDYRTPLRRQGNVAKHWNPNFKLSLIGPMVAAGSYFGADKIDELLVNFNYRSTLDKMKTYKFSNMLYVWITGDITDEDGTILPGVEKLLENPGEAYSVDRSAGELNVYPAGRGQGVKIPYLYKGFRADDVNILYYLLNDCYNGGCIFSQLDDDGDGVNEIGIDNGLVSPYEGELGLMTEFNGSDMLGVRSDAYYCEIDFIMVVALMGAMERLGVYNKFLDFDLYKRVWTGNADLIFKLANGYNCQANGLQHKMVATNSMGYNYMKAYWNEYFKSPSELIGE